MGFQMFAELGGNDDGVRILHILRFLPAVVVEGLSACSGSCAVFWRCQLAPFPDNQTEQLWKSMNGTDVSAGGLIVKAVDRLLTSSSATLQVCVWT